MLTPYGGAPPANLLDKVARGILAAKGSNDWPHSTRATRAMLVEIVRSRAREERSKSVIKEEGEVVGRDGSPLARRPLYRQSSMDFIRNAHIGSNAADTSGR
jgi:hypothetical protein